MKKIYSILFATVLTAGFSSCEMKDELWGHDSDPAEQGNLQMTLANNAQTTDVSTRAMKRDDATDNGQKVHVFAPEEVNVANYTLDIIENTNNTTVKSGTVSDLGGNNGSLSMTLTKGRYTAKAYNYDGANVNVSTRPYFAGTASFEILSGNTTNASIDCSLQCIEVAIALSQSFKDAFYQDGDKGYEITVDNGDGAIQTLTSQNIDQKYYFKVPEAKTSMTVSVKATTQPKGLVTEQLITRTYTVTKPADAEGNANLAGGDAFIINLKEDNSTAAYIDFGMTVDFSFADQTETILLPAENITYNENQGGGEDNPDNPDQPGSDAIKFVGLPATVELPAQEGETVAVTISAEKNIENLFVTITSSDEAFFGILGSMGLSETFDIANPGELETTLGDTEYGGIGLIKTGEPIKGEKQYVFDVTNFMSMLKSFTGEHKFSIRVVDAEGNENSGDLKVTVTE